jgi:hypothetical protein
MNRTAKALALVLFVCAADKAAQELARQRREAATKRRNDLK